MQNAAGSPAIRTGKYRSRTIAAADPAVLFMNELQRLFPTDPHEGIVTAFAIRFTRIFQIAFAHHRILNADIGMNLIWRGLL